MGMTMDCEDKSLVCTWMTVQGMGDVLEDAKRYADAALGEAKSYTDVALGEAKSYTDEKSETVLEDAKRYADEKSETVLEDAKSYTDEKSETVLEDAKSYTDEKSETVLEDAKRYADRDHEQNAPVKEYTYAQLCLFTMSAALVPGRIYILTDYELTMPSELNKDFFRPAPKQLRYKMALRAISSTQFDPRVTIIEAIKDGVDYTQTSRVNTWEVWYDFNGGYGVPDVDGNYPNADSIYLFVSDTSTMKGCIYKMIDQNDNECDYDFKNVQFVALGAGVYDERLTLNHFLREYNEKTNTFIDYPDAFTGWCYTFCDKAGGEDAGGIDMSLEPTPYDILAGYPACYNNKYTIDNNPRWPMWGYMGGTVFLGCCNNCSVGPGLGIIINSSYVNVSGHSIGLPGNMYTIGETSLHPAVSPITCTEISISGVDGNDGQACVILNSSAVYIHGPYAYCSIIGCHGVECGGNQSVTLAGCQGVRCAYGSGVDNTYDGIFGKGAVVMYDCEFKPGAGYILTTDTTTSENVALRSCAFYHAAGGYTTFNVTEDLINNLNHKDIYGDVVITPGVSTE